MHHELKYTWQGQHFLHKLMPKLYHRGWEWCIVVFFVIEVNDIYGEVESLV